MRKEIAIKLVVLVLVFLLIITPLSLWTDRNLNFWASHFKGHTMYIPFWLSFLLTIVVNGAAVFLNAIGEIARWYLQH